MRIPLRTYLEGSGTKVFSLVATLPFSPVDLDIGRLARGEWNPLTDRFRFWNLTPEGKGEVPLCHVMIRKFDPRDLVLVYVHVNMNLVQDSERSDRGPFTVGIMCNDDVRARLVLSTMFNIPPAFRRRNQARLVEKRWRTDPEAVMRYLANVHSVTSLPTSSVYSMKFEFPANLKDEFRKGLGGWWVAK
jgi:hypothetical protein